MSFPRTPTAVEPFLTASCVLHLEEVAVGREDGDGAVVALARAAAAQKRTLHSLFLSANCTDNSEVLLTHCHLLP